MITAFTGGDMSMLSRLMALGRFEDADSEWREKQALANGYIEQVLGEYFSRLGVNPFEESEA